MKATETEVLIIGAGPAGSMAAALLHREGFKVLVVEKQKFPRFVIGEPAEVQFVTRRSLGRCCGAISGISSR